MKENYKITAEKLNQQMKSNSEYWSKTVEQTLYDRNFYLDFKEPNSNSSGYIRIFNHSELAIKIRLHHETIDIWFNQHFTELNEIDHQEFVDYLSYVIGVCQNEKQ